MIDYSTLKMIWWLIIGILIIGFAIMDGHDMGVGMLLPFIGKNDDERRVVINSIAPHWEGNQIWFVVLGGSVFAALPIAYGTAFSGYYWAMLAVLWALFFRPVGFKYRSMIQAHRWRNTWDWLLLVGSFVPTLVFGVAFGNLLQGSPFYLNDELRSFYTGSFWGLLNPFALLCGVLAVAMFVFHGAVYLMIRSAGDVYQRTRKTLPYSAMITILAFAAGGIWIAYGIDGYVITSPIDPSGSSDPLYKTVALERGAWLNNYKTYPLTMLIPALGFVGILLALVLARIGKTGLAFISSSCGLAGIIATAGVSMFPFLMPSSTDPRSSLTVWDSMSSHHTLLITLVGVIIFLPIIVAYTSWAFYVLRGKITEEDIRANTHSRY
ncbi:cytochrome d ubiquinol oxidase subunit II [Cardiobacteriaceae bacterium TAE3-ERU3]|nr:cytochrome d ubiquinol oxidase subunit II [Cardiobacteriaceae bacterium TAE3-ERU3]